MVKEKKPRGYHQKVTDKYSELLAAYAELERHARCYCGEYRLNPSEILALSDMVISYPFTSTSFEALSAGKKAVWYDPAGKYMDSYYAETPGLVMHTYEDLLSRVKQLLYIETGGEYDRYLREHVKDKIEPFLDGKAISRFRALLRKEGACA